MLLQRLRDKEGCEECDQWCITTFKRRSESGKCKTVRSNVHELRFCSRECRDECKKTKNRGPVRGPASLDHVQIVSLYRTLRDIQPWCAVLMLLQLFTGEHISAAIKYTWDGIEEKAQRSAYFAPFKRFLYKWSQVTTPLVSKPQGPLFPGWSKDPQKRPDRAYRKALGKAKTCLDLQLSLSVAVKNSADEWKRCKEWTRFQYVIQEVERVSRKKATRATHQAN